MTIPASVTNIGSIAFSGCSSLTSITIPDGVTNIGSSAFSGCSSLTSITIPDGVTGIEDRSFRSCSSLTGITIPDGVTTIGNYAFEGCSNLTDVYFTGSREKWNQIDIGTSNNKLINAIIHCADDIAVTEIILEKTSVSIISGETLQLPFTVAPTNATIQSVRWNSSDEQVAVVNAQGIIKGLGSGTATITATAVDGSGVTAACIVTVIPGISIENATVSGLTSNTYTGEALTPTPIVVLDSTTLELNTDYTVSYSNNTNVGTATVTITGKGNYTGTKTATFTINKASISSATVSGMLAKTYTGSVITQSPTVTVGERTLISGTDYSLSYKDNINVGTATITITGMGNYTGVTSATFTINAASVSVATVSGLSAKTFTGSTITQTPTVTVDERNLVSGTDYSLSYKDNTNAGTATVTITGMGNYTGTATATFKINQAAQSITAKASASTIAVGKTATVSITGAKGTKSYKSSNTDVATVTSAGKVTAKKVGAVTITATSAATANYKAASKTVKIMVVPAATTTLKAENQATGIKLTWKKVTGANGYKVYRGSTLVKTITSGSTVTYTDTKANTNGTKYTFKIVAKAATGDSTLSKSLVTYRVARPAISSATNSTAGKMTVKWAKNAKATGYQIQYSTSKTFASGNKAVSVTSASTVSKVIGSLTKGKTYYVRMRTYKTVGSTKYWSAWSVAKTVKITK